MCVMDNLERANGWLGKIEDSMEAKVSSPKLRDGLVFSIASLLTDYSALLKENLFLKDTIGFLESFKVPKG